MPGPWEKYAAAPAADGPWAKYQGTPAPAPVGGTALGGSPPPNPFFEVAAHSAPAAGASPSYAPPAIMPSEGVSLSRALLTNDPTRGFIEGAARSVPATIGGALGAAAAAPTGPLSIPAAGLGAAGGEGARQALVQAYMASQGRPYTAPGDVATHMGVQGAASAIGQGAAVGLGAGLRYLGRTAAPAGMKVMANVPERSAAAAAQDPAMLLRAPSDQAVTDAYDAFHAASGTVSRRQSIAASEDPFDTVSRAMNTMKDAYNNLRAGKLTMQEAVDASQAARIIGDMKSRGVEMAQQVAQQSGDLKGLFDDFIQKGMAPAARSVHDPLTGGLQTVMEPGMQGYPEWQAARQAAFENSVAGDLGSFYPRNVNGSPNVARFWAALHGGAVTGAAGGAALAGPPGAVVGAGMGAMVGAAAVSPLTYGTALKAAAYAGNIPAGVYRVPTSMLADQYLQRRPVTP